jgi:hypothetical protein
MERRLDEATGGSGYKTAFCIPVLKAEGYERKAVPMAGPDGLDSGS